MILAITGGTGFVGARLIDLALADGHEVRALTRRKQPPRAGLTWIAGDLARPGALCDSADAVIHVAGVVNAADREGFAAGNVAGTQGIVAAATAAGLARIVHVSSLAAREPGLSDYGWSKAGAEEAVMASDRAWTIVRPPAVYGPGDLEMRDIFRAARWGVVPVPPPGMISVIHVDDLARLLLATASGDAGRRVLDPDDGAPLSNAAFVQAIALAAGRRVMPLPLPAPLLMLAARADRRVRGDKAKLTPDRAAYLSHPDWVSDPDNAVPASLWTPRIALADGLADTVAWYRARDLL